MKKYIVLNFLNIIFSINIFLFVEASAMFLKEELFFLKK